LNKLISVVALFLALAGCATKVPQYSSDPTERQRAQIHTELASGYYSQNLWPLAMTEYNTAIEIDSNYAPAYIGLAMVYAVMAQDDKAEANFKRALDIEPGNPESHNNYGVFLCSRNRIDESLTQFMTAVKEPLYYTPQTAWLNAGICALKKKDATNAETYLFKALSIQPGLSEASYQLATIYFSRGDYLQARERLQRAMQNTEATPDMLLLGVRIERILGGKDAEASYSMLLRKKYPDSDQTRILLSE
jgi:type IV pilus assembly protein PilF